MTGRKSVASKRLSCSSKDDMLHKRRTRSRRTLAGTSVLRVALVLVVIANVTLLAQAWTLSRHEFCTVTTRSHTHPARCKMVLLQGQQQAHRPMSLRASSSSTRDANNDMDEHDNQQEAKASSTRTAVTGVTLKMALDAKGGAADLAAVQSDRFTSPESLDMVHRLRHVSDAVLIGRATVQADNPSLTVRRGLPNSILSSSSLLQQPARVILDPWLTILNDGKTYQILHDGMAKTIIYHCHPSPLLSNPEFLAKYKNLELVSLEPAQDNELVERTTGMVPKKKVMMSVKAVLQDLMDRRGMKHIMVEGGPATARLFLQDQLIDRVILVKAPISFRQALAAGISETVLENAGLTCIGTSASGVDQLEYWSRTNPPWPTEIWTDWP